MNYSEISFLLILSVLAIILIGCANQQPPQGGPIDTTTPKIILTYPESNTRNFSDDKIRLEFDRYVDERTLEESIFISPYIGTLEFDWSGREVEISFSEKLRDSTTYVVNIGTDVRDRFRNQMRMAESYTLAFSTGPDIDRGGIEGLVFSVNESDPRAGILIFAYNLNRVDPDTLNPMTAKPDFITQTGTNGDFFLYHIPFGSYRVFAVRDEYRNLVYDQEADDYGVPSSMIDITSDDTLAAGVLMKLAREDTTGPRLIKANAIDRNHIVAEFSESINSESITQSSFVVVDTLDQKSLDIVTAFLLPSRPTECIVVTQDQDSTKLYRFTVQDVTDSIGNKINPLANSFTFEGSSRADTIGPNVVSASIKDSVRNIGLQPVINIIFSDAVSRVIPLDFIDILDQNKKPISTAKEWISDVQVSIVPAKELIGKSWYSLHAELFDIHDWTGRACRDSVKSLHFETLDPENMSSVEGSVNDISGTDSTGRIYTWAIQVGGKNPKRYVTAADARGKFVFPLVDEGQYVFQAFRDRNNNGTYDFGMPFPFAYSERLSGFSDTLKVRARWPLEGVNVQLR